MKCRSPRRQSTSRSLVRNDATIMRTRLCIQPRRQQLAHPRVHDRVAGAAVAPGREPLVAPAPGERVVLGPERAVLDVREVPQHVRVEVAPAQLGDELRGRASAARASACGRGPALRHDAPTPSVPNLRSADRRDVARSRRHVATRGVGREAVPAVVAPRSRSSRARASRSPAGHGAAVGGAKPSARASQPVGREGGWGRAAPAAVRRGDRQRLAGALRNGVYTLYGLPEPVTTSPGGTSRRSWKRFTRDARRRATRARRRRRARAAAGSYSSFQ